MSVLKFLRGRWAVAALAMACICAPAASQGIAATGAVSADEAREIAVEAYIYAYPMVLMELTRRVGIGAPGAVPVNQFLHRKAFPDANFTEVVRPNADTLYSTLWFDVSKGPLVITVPASGGRYYLLQALDFWTDTFAVPGTRTTGNASQVLVLAGPRWQGEVPAGAMLIRTPTATGWIIGRTQTNGAADYAEVHKFQAGLEAAPLESVRASMPASPQAEDGWDVKTPPVVQVEKLDAQAFFSLFAELARANPPHANDYPILHRMARIGIAPRQPFSLAALTADQRRAIEAAPAVATAKIKAGIVKYGTRANGWRTILNAIGTYGTNYLGRAFIAYGGLGANPVEDAVYPSAFADADGQPFSSDKHYVLHFAKADLPPVRAFWSLTMYDARQLFAANPIHRFAIGDRDKLNFNADGSLDIYIQRESPGPGRESNWLPAPASGPFTMNLRLYWPKAVVG